MIDLSKPEIKQAYLTGIDVGRATFDKELDRVAVVTETRIVCDLEAYRERLLAKGEFIAAGAVTNCIAVVTGEETND